MNLHKKAQEIKFTQMHEWQSIHALTYIAEQSNSKIIEFQLNKLIELCPTNTFLPKSYYQKLANIAFCDEEQALIVHALRIDYALSAINKNLDITKEKLLKVMIILPRDLQDEFKNDIDAFEAPLTLCHLEKAMDMAKLKLEAFAKSFTFEKAYNHISTLNTEYKEAFRKSELHFIDVIQWPKNAEHLRNAAFLALQNDLECLNTVDEKIKLCESVLTFPVFCKPYNQFYSETLVEEIKAIQASLNTIHKEEPIFPCEM